MIKRIFRWFRGLFILIWVIAVFAISLWIAWNNPEHITVNLFAIDLPSYSVGGYIATTFALGVVLGWFGTWILARVKLYSRKRELSKVKKEVNKLRTARLES